MDVRAIENGYNEELMLFDLVEKMVIESDISKINDIYKSIVKIIKNSVYIGDIYKKKMLQNICELYRKLIDNMNKINYNKNVINI